MAIRNSLIEAYGLNSPGKNLLEHAGNHDYSGFNPSNSHQNIQINYDNINNYIHITQNSASITGAYRYVNNIESGKIYNLSFYVYSEYSGTLRNCFENSTEIYGSNLTFNANEWNKCWITSKAVDKNIVFYVKNTSFKIRNIKLTECTEKDCYFFQYTDINDELKPFVYNFKDLQINCRYTEYFSNDNPINELISWENFKYLLKEFVEYEEWQYSDDKSYRTRNTISIIDWCDGSNKSSVSNIEREDATIEYGTPELTLVVNDIPASGGTISDGTVSYGQSKYYVYSDARFKVTDESGVITDGLIWGDPVTAQSLGTTIKDRSIVGSLSVSTTINGKTESTTVDVYQQANRIESYGTPTGRTLSVSDIPASGGTISRGTLGGTITQSCTYTSGSNGTLTNPTITSSSYSASITAGSLGTTIKDRTKVGTLTYTYVCNKKTGSISADVYQQANNATDITYGDWSVSLSANKYTTSSSPAPASGGTAAITSSASRTRIQNYTSGATSKLSNETASPSLNVTGSGFTLSESNVIVANRTTTEGSSRTGSVTATYGGVSKSIALYQAENKLTGVTITGSTSDGTVMNISAGGGKVTWTPKVQYSSGSNVTPPSGVSIKYSLNYTNIGASQSGNVTTWENRSTIIGAWRGVDVTASATSSYTTKAVTGTEATGQNMNTVTDVNFIDCQGSAAHQIFSAAGGAYCYVGELTLSSGSKIQGANYKDYITYSFSSDFGTWTLDKEGYYGTVSASSRGYTLGAKKTGTLTYKISGTINKVSIDKTASVALTQKANIVTAVSIVNVSGDIPTSSFTAAGSSGYNYYGKATYSSGNTQLSGINAERFSYTLSGTGFSKSDATNKSYTKVIVDNRTTTIGNSRTGSLVVSFTNPSFTGYTNTVSSPALTLTQAQNTITGITVVSGAGASPVTSVPASGDTVEIFPQFTFSSGSIGWNKSASQSGTWSGTATGFTVSVIEASSSYGRRIVAANRGTTIGAARSIVSTFTLNTTINDVAINKSATHTLTQALNKVVSCTETNNTLSYPSIAAGGGTSSPSGMTTARFTYSSGATGDPSGYVWTKSFSMTASNGFSINTTSGVVTATNNTTTNSRTSNTITRVAKCSYTNPSSVGGDTVSATLTKTATCTQSAGYKSYANPVVSLSYSDIPASGGAVSPTYSYSQTWGWNGATSGGGIITSGGTLKWTGCTDNTTGKCSATSKGTVVSTRSSVAGSATLTVTLNGKSGSKSTTVYQALNTITSFTYVNGAGSSPTTSFAASASSAIYYPYFTFSSGSVGLQKTYSNEVDYSISGSGFSLGSISNVTYSYGQTVAVASRGTTIGTARTGTLTGTLNTTINGVAINKSAKLSLTQAANSMTREYSNLSGHISSTTWANKANYTGFWAEGSYTEKYTSGATGSSGSGDIPWDSVTFGGADWVYYDSVQGVLKWYDNTGSERSTTITGKIGSWTYSVKVTQKAGMSVGRLYLHVPVNIGYVEYWNIYVNSTSGGEIWSGHPDMYGSANNILKMPEECAIIVAQNGGTVSFSTSYSTATDRTYRGSISGTEQDRLADGEDITVYLT